MNPKMGKSSMDFKGNKGDWAELYVMLRLLSEGRIAEGDEFLRPIPDAYIDILSVLRKEAETIMKYSYNQDMVIVFSGEDEVAKVPTCKVKVKADELLKCIPKISRAEHVSEMDDIMQEMHIHSVKAASVSDKNDPLYGGKNDIVVTARDRSGAVNNRGFSIKSTFKNSPPTLFNFGKGSSIVYKVENCNDEEMYKINAMVTDIRKKKYGEIKSGDLASKIKYIKDSQTLSLTPMGSKLTKEAINGVPIFQINLLYRSNDTINVIEELLLQRWGYYSDDTVSDLSHLIDEIEKRNPLNYPAQSIYRCRIGDFLYDSFGGMTSSQLWDGVRRVNGGYIEVKNDGSILFYPARSDHQFISYLIRNMNCEAPQQGWKMLAATLEAEKVLYGEEDPYVRRYYDEQTKDKKKKNANIKGDYGYIYKSKDYSNDNQEHYYLDLNFSARFKSTIK